VAIEPDEQQLAEVARRAAQEGDGTVVMLNLNRYRDRAVYEEDVPGGLDPDVSGHEAYMRYGAVATQVIERVGGSIDWYTTSEGSVIGDDADRYDEIVAARYPSYAAFLQLVFDPELLAAAAHRRAALERAAVICCAPGVRPD